MKSKYIKGFTLVELLVVITILAILFTVGFISFKNYVKDARDGGRVADISNLTNGLEISNVKLGKYPDPDKKDGQSLLQTGALSISGSIIEYSYLGVVGDSVTRQLSLTKVPQDPLTGDKYIYTKTIDGKKYQIASILENPTGYAPSPKGRGVGGGLLQANAGNDGYVAKVEGNHKDIVIRQTSSGKYITVVPSLVFDPSGSNILNQTGTLSIVNNKGNLPYSPTKSTIIGNTTTAEKLIREIRNNELATVATLKLPDGVTLDGSGVLNEWWIPNKNGTNWNTYSSGVILASLGSVGVDGGADYTKLTAVLNGWSVPETTTQATTAVTPSYDVGNSLRFNGSNSYLSRTFGTPNNNKKLTMSFWVKRSNLNRGVLFSGKPSSGAYTLEFYSDNTIYLGGNNLTTGSLQTTAVFRDVSTWYNVIVQYDVTNPTNTERVKLWVNGERMVLNGIFPPGNDLDINTNGDVHYIGSRGSSSNLYFDGYMSEINFIDGEALDPTSFGQFDTNGRWVPKSYDGAGVYIPSTYSSDVSSNTFAINGGTIGYASTSYAFDSIGGIGSTWGSTQTYGSVSGNAYLGQDFGAGNEKNIRRIGLNQANGNRWINSVKVQYSDNGSSWLDVKIINPTTSGDVLYTYDLPYVGAHRYWRLLANSEPVGGASYNWEIYELEMYEASQTSIYGTNGFHLDFSSGATNSTGIGKDRSGNNNDWTPYNFNTYDQMLDSPTNDFATMNPLAYANSLTFSQGNLNLSGFGASTYSNNIGTISMFDGSYYEASPISSSKAAGVGLASSNLNQYVNSNNIGSVPGAGQLPSLNLGVSFNDGNISWNNTSVGTLGAFSSGDVLRIAYKNGKVRFGKNNSWFNSGDPSNDLNPTYTGLSGNWLPFISGTNYFGAQVTIFNFGQGGQTLLQYCADAGGYFKYCPPTGFKALSTKNITYPIENPKQYFDVLTYTGNGTSQSLTGLAFQPDFMWFKSRTDYGGNSGHALLDSIRGITKFLKTHSTDQENTDNGIVTSIKTNGYDLGTSGFSNADGRSYVSWNWKKSSSSGFDMVNYTGNSTAGRSLPVSLGGKSPDFAIIKRTNAISDWAVYHKNITAGRVLWLQSTVGINDVSTDDSSYNDQIQTTNDALILGATQSVNNSAGNYIAYVWSEILGYSKFGSYTGNGSTTGDGPFVYTGFKPKYIMWKAITANGIGGQNWTVVDTARTQFNGNNGVCLNADLYNNEVSSCTSNDILSNGFKIRDVSNNDNAANNTYIYAAFAELPFK